MTCSHNCTKSPRIAASREFLGDPNHETHSVSDTENVIQKKGTVQRPECRSMARGKRRAGQLATPSSRAPTKSLPRYFAAHFAGTSSHTPPRKPLPAVSYYRSLMNGNLLDVPHRRRANENGVGRPAIQRVDQITGVLLAMILTRHRHAQHFSAHIHLKELCR